MISEEDSTAKTALSFIRRHGNQVIPVIEDEISASTARSDWEQVRQWCRVRLRVSRMLLAQRRSEAAEWRSVYPDPAKAARLPWIEGDAPLPGPDPSVA